MILFQVGPGSDWDPTGDGGLADETSQELFRGQEIGLDLNQYYCICLGDESLSVKNDAFLGTFSIFFVRNLIFVTVFSSVLV